MLANSLDKNTIRRLRYAHDEAYRQRRINEALQAQGLMVSKTPRKSSWTFAEVCSVLNVSATTIRVYEKAGLVPKPTYPAKVRRYYPHQVLLLAQLFQRMRQEGWPVRIPKMGTHKHWTRFLKRLQSEWTARGPIHVEWSGR